MTLSMLEIPPQTSPPADEPPGTILPFKRKTKASTQLVQLSLTGAAPLPTSGIVSVTTAFRNRVVRRALGALNGGKDVKWIDATAEHRARVRLLSGRDPGGAPLRGDEHLRVLLWFEDDRPTRLLLHRDTPFHPWELSAIQRAAEEPLLWLEAAGASAEVPLAPMDAAMPPPPGFDGTASRVWSSVTEMVPPLPVLDSADRLVRGIGVDEQIAREMAVLGRPAPRRFEERIDDGDQGWTRLRTSRRLLQDGPTPARLGFRLRLTFGEAITGPIFLGQSSSCGLGLFRPEEDAPPPSSVIS